MPRNSQVGMFSIPNFLGGSSVLANQGLQSSGLGGSSGSLTAVNPFGGGGTPTAREEGAVGPGGPRTLPTNPYSACMHSMAVTGNPTPCPPNQSHQPAPCGPCTVIGDPVQDPSSVGLTTDPGVAATLTGSGTACPTPTSPSPGKPGSHTWNTSTCTWDPSAQYTPPRNLGMTDEGKKIRDIVGGTMQYGRNRGAQSRQQLGQFGRMGGGVGGGAMGDLEMFENPLLAGGSPYLAKNVSQFAYGGKMRDTYNYGGKMKNPYKYPDGGRADFMSGMRRGMNSAVAAGQIQEVVRNNRSSRRFISGGKF